LLRPQEPQLQRDILVRYRGITVSGSRPSPGKERSQMQGWIGACPFLFFIIILTEIVPKVL